MGVYVELKGQGCRQYEEFLNGNENNWVTLVNRLYQYQVNFTRIDIANDIMMIAYLFLPFMIIVVENYV